VFGLPKSVGIYLAATPVDMRNSIDGLAALVRNEWKEDVYCGHLFAFVSKRGDRVKILVWERGGFVLYYKRLERGRFRVPSVEDDALGVQLDSAQLTMLLEGIDYSRVRRPRPWEPPEEKLAEDRQRTGSLIKPGRWQRSPKTIVASGASGLRQPKAVSPPSKLKSKH
jgi:transposase